MSAAKDISGLFCVGFNLLGRLNFAAKGKLENSMYIDSPSWTLKQRCPCCKEGILELCACDECQKVIAVCDELDTVFIDPLDISIEKTADDNSEVCPYCKAKGKIRRAKDFEIIALGLTVKDYE